MIFNLGLWLCTAYLDLLAKILTIVLCLLFNFWVLLELPKLKFSGKAGSKISGLYSALEVFYIKQFGAFFLVLLSSQFSSLSHSHTYNTIHTAEGLNFSVLKNWGFCS